jgi:hypothetical protein
MNLLPNAAYNNGLTVGLTNLLKLIEKKLP